MEWELSLLHHKCQLVTLAKVYREFLRLTNSSPTMADLKTIKSQVGPDVLIRHRGISFCKETPREYTHSERKATMTGVIEGTSNMLANPAALGR